MMTYPEFKSQLMQSLMETAKDSLKRRDETSNPLQYAIHNSHVELLRNQMQWITSQNIEPIQPCGTCCHDAEKMEVPE